MPYLYVYGPHINLRNLLLEDIYVTRKIMNELSNPYFGYTYSAFTKIIIPLMILFALELKQWVLLLIGIIYLILFYLFGAHKTVYLGLIVLLVFYKLSYYSSVFKMFKFASILALVALFLAFLGSDQLWILIFRRTHFLPTLLDICYLDFFQGKPIYWSGSFLKRFITYPYEMGHTKMIGDYYFHKPDMSANNGLIADGYMNFGSIGVVINVILVSLYFAVLNSLKIPSRYFGIYLLTILSFVSSSLFTVFITHGAIGLLIISIFILNEKKSKNLSPNISTS
ncbi:MAG: hypothetical protein EVB12_00675 [Winogradskyella sp.]|nr:MAG: hypothetical protein EVB12_00675 [Winogradskyella sp.]